MKRALHLALLLALIGFAACTPENPASPGPSAGTSTETVPSAPGDAPSTTTTSPSAASAEPALQRPAVYASTIEIRTAEPPFDWSAADVKLLDPWGDAPDDRNDLTALYERSADGQIELRVDLLDLGSGDHPELWLAIDYEEGGRRQADPARGGLTFDVAWDLLVGSTKGVPILYDAEFNDLSQYVSGFEVNTRLDFVKFDISAGVLSKWDGGPFGIQAAVVGADQNVVFDSTAPARTDDITGRAKLVLAFGNGMISEASGIDWYDGYAMRPGERPGERRGFRYLLDAVERYRLPLTWFDTRLDLIPTNEFLGIDSRLSYLAREGLFSPMLTPAYGYFMPWQPRDATLRALQISSSLWKEAGIDPSSVAAPYEGMITADNIEVLRRAGLRGIWGSNQYRYWFGWIDDWSNEEAVRDDVEALRKVHLINGMPFLFDMRINNAQGFIPDDRWGEIDWASYSEYDQYLGTDDGLDWMWRRVLQDMALSVDQEQFFEIGTDLLLVPWVFADVADQNMGWLAAHPWIEVTTPEAILQQNWQPIDHGTLPVAPDQLLIRYPKPDDLSYNAYFPLHYHGGIADGHSPLVSAGTEIDAYADYTPYLRSGRPIPSGRSMGDDDTPGSIVDETLGNLRSAPDNDLTTLAWLAYFNRVGEQTFHGEYDLETGEVVNAERLGRTAQIQANLLGQVNKITSAADWAEQARLGHLQPLTSAEAIDLDLDGEDEYILSNDRVFAVFENDGGRLEYGFAFDSEYGMVQVVAPRSEFAFMPADPVQPEDGEVAIPLAWPTIIDGAFVEDLRGDGEFDYRPFSASIEGDSIVFVSPSGYRKAYTLDGNTIICSYSEIPSETLTIGVSMTASTGTVFNGGWPASFERVQGEGQLGWQFATGGAGIFSADQPVGWVTAASFADSPAPVEMQGRADQSTYPPGHWLPIPLSSIVIGDAVPGKYSLTLQVRPVGR